MNNEKILTQLIAVADQVETIGDEVIKIETLLLLAKARVGMIEMVINLKLEAMNLRLEQLESA